MSEFLEKAKKTGRIKPLQEAFEDYPVSEEYHSGKIENLRCSRRRGGISPV